MTAHCHKQKPLKRKQIIYIWDCLLASMTNAALFCFMSVITILFCTGLDLLVMFQIWNWTLLDPTILILKDKLHQAPSAIPNCLVNLKKASSSYRVGSWGEQRSLRWRRSFVDKWISLLDFVIRLPMGFTLHTVYNPQKIPDRTSFWPSWSP